MRMPEVYTMLDANRASVGGLMKFRTGLLLILAGGCAPGEPAPCASGEPGDVDLEAPAGIRQTSMSYDLPWDGSTRELDLHLWYPTSATTGEPAEYIGIFDDEFSLLDAPFAGEEERDGFNPRLDESVDDAPADEPRSAGDENRSFDRASHDGGW